MISNIILNIVVAACVVVGLFGIAVTLWSVHHTHCMIRARGRRMDALEAVATQTGTMIVAGSVTAGRVTMHRPPPPAPSITDRIEVLRPKAGDMLVVQIDRPLTDDQRKSIKDMVGPHVPAGVTLVVLDAAASVKHVVSPIA